MLYKNDEPYRLDTRPEERKAIEKYFHNKFPVKVIYPPERVHKNRLKHNAGKMDQPKSISFDFKSIVKTEKGTDVWRYAENVVTDNKGNKKYTPKKFIFNGSRYLGRTDIEMIYFLLRTSEYCKGGDNQGPIVKFMFEDLVSTAEKKAEKKEIETKVSNLIYNKDTGLPEDRLRAVAVAFCGISTSKDEYTLAQVKMLLYDKIMSTPEGPDRFFNMTENEINTRLDIQKVIDMGVLKFNDVKRTWSWQTAGEKGNLQVCKVPPNKTPMETLYDTYLGDQVFRDDIKAVLLTRNPHAGKAKKDEEDNEE